MSRWVGRLIAVNVIVLLLQSNPFVTFWMEFRPVWVLWRPWTVVTYMFAHAGFWHLFWNMFGLWIFGPRVEMRLGGPRFLGLYFASGLAAALAQGFFAPEAAMIGASGAVFGVTLAFAYWWPRERIYIWMVLPVEAWLLVTIYAGLNLWEGVTRTGGEVANFAHLGGIAGAFLYIKLLERYSPAARFRRLAAPAAAPRQLLDVGRWKTVDLSRLHPVNREEYERVMAKLQADGLGGLSPGDIEFLERFSRPAN